MAHSKPQFVGTYIYLRVEAAPGDQQSGTKALRKTAVWSVRTQDGDNMLGLIKWFGAWRCFVFEPAANTLFEPTCLHEIAVICNMATQQHQKSKAKF